MLTDIAECRTLLQDGEPLIVNAAARKEAAVAMLLSQGLHSTECLLIERAWRDGDPWSGQMAFPGGRLEKQDADVLTTAIRETAEEIGIVLSGENRIARLDDLVAPKLSHARGMVISCHVFEVPRSIRCTPNEEVHDLVWVPLAALLKDRRHVTDYQPPDYDGRFPGFRLNDDDHRVIWGLTYRIMRSFFRKFGIIDFNTAD